MFSPSRTPFAPAGSARVFPFPTERIVRAAFGRPGDQVCVTHAGETVIYPSPQALRAAVLAHSGDLVAAQAAAQLKAERQRRRAEQAGAIRALLTVAAIVGALAGFGLYGLQQLQLAGWL